MPTFGARAPAPAAGARPGEALGDTELAAIVDAVTDATLVRDAAGRLLRANLPAVELLGYASLPELLGSSMRELLDRIDIRDASGAPVPLSELPGSVALRGGEPVEQVLQIRRRGTTEVRWALVRARGVRDDSGSVACAVLSFSDPAPHRRPERRERFLARATATLAESLDYETTLRRAASLAVPDLADWCVVDSVEPGGRVKRIAVAHSEADQREHAWRLTKRHPIRPDNEIGPPQVIRSGRSALFDRVADHHLRAFAHDPEHLDALRGLGLRSVMIIPLRTRGRTHGALTFALTRAGSRYARADLALAEELALPLRAGRRQRAALRPPAHRRTHAAGRAGAAGPAAGRGPRDGRRIPARRPGPGRERRLLRPVRRPRRLDRRGGRRLRQRRRRCRGHRPAETFPAGSRRAREQPRAPVGSPQPGAVRGPVDELATLVCARLQRRGDHFDVTLVSAGHPPALVRRAAGDVEPVAASGTILGAVEEPRLEESSVDLAPGDLLLLYTDGLIEARGPEGMLGEQAVAERLSATAGPEDAVRSLESLAVEAQAGDPLHNDIALLALRVRAAGPAIRS